MNLNEYQKKAWSFILPSANNLQYLTSNLSAEGGELQGLVAKAVRDGAKPDFHERAKKELGDMLWQVSALAKFWNMELEDVAQSNIDKLESRTERGKIGGSGDER